MTFKLTDTDVEEIQRLLMSGETQENIAAKFGVHVMTVSNISRGESWTSVRIPGFNYERKGNRGEKNKQSRLTEDDVRDIRLRISSGETQKSVAKLYGLQQSYVSLIKNGKLWKHVSIEGK